MIQRILKEKQREHLALSKMQKVFLKLNLVMEGGSLEYEYTLSEDHTVLELCSPGTDTIHRWTKHRIYDIIAFIECPFCGRDRFEKKE